MKILINIQKDRDCEVDVPETYTINDLKKHLLKELNIQYDDAYFKKTKIIYQKKVLRDDNVLLNIGFFDGVKVSCKIPSNKNSSLESNVSSTSTDSSFPQISTSQTVLQPSQAFDSNSSLISNNPDISFPQISTQQNTIPQNQAFIPNTPDPLTSTSTPTINDFSFPQISTQQNVIPPDQILYSSTVNPIASTSAPANSDFSFPQISTQQNVIPPNYPSFPNTPSSTTSMGAPVNNNFSFPQISTQQRVYAQNQPSSNPMQYQSSANSDFSFPQITTQQAIHTPNQIAPTNQNMYFPSQANPMMNQIQSLFQGYMNMDYRSLENNVNQLVSLGFPERGSRNALRMLGNNLDVAQKALSSGMFLDDKSNKLIEGLLNNTMSPEQRQQAIRELTQDIISKVYSDQLPEDRQYIYQESLNKYHQIQNSFYQMNPAMRNAPYLGAPQPMPMIQHNNLSRQEFEILPLLRNALSGLGNSTENPFVVYLGTTDDSQFQSEEIFDKFLMASNMEEPQWKFVAKCLLNNIGINEAFFYLECSNDDPIAAESLIRENGVQ